MAKNVIIIVNRHILIEKEGKPDYTPVHPLNRQLCYTENYNSFSGSVALISGTSVHSQLHRRIFKTHFPNGNFLHHNDTRNTIQCMRNQFLSHNIFGRETFMVNTGQI